MRADLEKLTGQNASKRERSGQPDDKSSGAEPQTAAQNQLQDSARIRAHGHANPNFLPALRHCIEKKLELAQVGCTRIGSRPPVRFTSLPMAT